MRIALYIVWFLIPAFFFIMALWAKLEQISNQAKKQNPGDFLRQGGFVLGCVLLALLIERMLLESLVKSLSPEWIPLTFYQIILLPLIFVIAAKVVGPSKEIRISKSTTQNRRRRN